MSERILYTDKQLFAQISDGSEQAFTMLFHRYVPQLLALATKLTKYPAVSENIIQEIFVRVWLSRDKLGEIENPAAWLFRVATNECYRALRKEVLLASVTTPHEEVSYEPEVIQLRELSVLVKEAIATLPEQRQKIFRLSREGAMTIPQIAEHLQLSPNTVKNALVSSLKMVRAFLQTRGYTLPVVLLLWIR